MCPEARSTDRSVPDVLAVSRCPLSLLFFFIFSGLQTPLRDQAGLITAGQSRCCQAWLSLSLSLAHHRCRTPRGGRAMDAIYHRTHLGDALLHALQKLCVSGELEGAEARRILADFDEVQRYSIVQWRCNRFSPASHSVHSRLGCGRWGHSRQGEYNRCWVFVRVTATAVYFDCCAHLNISGYQSIACVLPSESLPPVWCPETDRDRETHTDSDGGRRGSFRKG